MSFLRRLLGVSRSPKLGDLLAKAHATTIEENALRTAADAAKAKGLLWNEPILAEYRYSPEGNYWLIQSNWTGRDHRVFVTVDDRTGNVSRVESHGRNGPVVHGA
jgi:hypothetical protein